MTAAPPLDFSASPTLYPVQKVTICIATRGRPQLLARCLQSLERQVVERWLYVRVMVACNGPEGVQATHEACQAFKRFPLTFTHDQTPGIARARNVAMIAAYKDGADWIAFIDDDEQAEQFWLLNLMKPELLRSAPILAGRNKLIYPTPAPFWCLPPKDKREHDVKLCTTSGAGNVRFSAELVAAGLRFDERLALTGGEDNDFFSRARRAGFEIYKTPDAVTYEAVHADRLTLRGQAYRNYWIAASGVHREARQDGRTAVFPRMAASGVVAIAEGLACVAGGVLALVCSQSAFKRLVLRGVKRIAKGCGRLVAIAGWRPQPYRVVSGS